MSESSDRPLLDLIRRRGPLTVAEMAEALGVTPTAIRNPTAKPAAPDPTARLLPDIRKANSSSHLRRTRHDAASALR